MGDTSAQREGRGGKRKTRNRRHNPDGTMSLIEHIYEFRRRVGYALLALIGGGIIGFLWFGHGIGPIPTLGDLVTEPYCAIPQEQRYPKGGDCQLLQTVPFEAFMIQMKVGLSAGAVLFSPLWLYQLWAFIAPGLYSKERKYAMTFVAIASLLFTGGALLAYFMAPHALEILTTFGAGEFATWFTGDKYISFVLSLLLIFGVSFELPLLIIMLNRVGVVHYATLKKWRRGIIMIMFVFAAFVTPADPFSMIGLAGALCILFEISLQITRFHDRKLDRKRGAEGWDELSDDEPAPFEYTPSTADDGTDGGRRGGTDDIT
ncbi:twin-arginine translocase subunit TatC [Prauserella halophila]|uniref:Sec-independent protein translocase protein TatC n=1 Tax=Prauserella halophila TaxID=185641 RepID=A0ABN1VZL5_9PSEU|nr:twin-arginine translocase subunit TatC [Prauserella halophila]MCP2237201.1 sec-independent protein translocase protein TatC [Prauserella halophila]